MKHLSRRNGLKLHETDLQEGKKWCRFLTGGRRKQKRGEQLDQKLTTHSPHLIDLQYEPPGGSQITYSLSASTKFVFRLSWVPVRPFINAQIWVNRLNCMFC